jgi:hypothetical protein
LFPVLLTVKERADAVPATLREASRARVMILDRGMAARSSSRRRAWR